MLLAAQPRLRGSRSRRRGRQARLRLARVARNGDVDWWRDLSSTSRRSRPGSRARPSKAEPIVVYDVAGSPLVNPPSGEQVGAKSAVFIPLVSDERVPAVLVVATTGEPQGVQRDELALLQALAAEAALALDRARSASALAEALERERLVASIGRKVRSELDLDAVLGVAVEETGRALGVARCFLRLGEPGGPMPIAAEWDAEGFVPIGRGRTTARRVEPRSPRAANGAVGDVARGRGARRPGSRRCSGAARPRHPGGARHAGARFRPDDRSLRVPPPGSRGLAGGGGRRSPKRSRASWAGDPRRAASRRRTTAARAAGRAAQGRAGRDERAPAGNRPSAARGRSDEAARRRRRGLLPVRRGQLRPPLRRRLRARPGARRVRVPDRLARSTGGSASPSRTDAYEGFASAIVGADDVVG